MTWPTKKLDEVCEISAGGSAPQGKRFFENGEYPFFRTSDVGAVHLSDNLYDVRDYLNGQGIKGLNLFKKETILFPKSGASTFLNHRVIMGCDGYVASHLATISAGKNIDFRYLYLFLILVDAKDIAPNSSYPSLRITDIGKINIPLPPLEIQRKVVKKIEELFDKITQVQSLRESATQDTNNLIPATISKIFEEGKKKGWEEKIVEDVATKITKGTTPKTLGFQLTSTGVPFLRAENIDGEVNAQAVKLFMSKETSDALERSKTQNGDVLITIAGTIGRVGWVPLGAPEMNMNQAVAIIRPKINIISTKFLVYTLRGRTMQDQVSAGTVKAAIPNFSLTMIRGMTILLPPLTEQMKIVERMDALTQKVRELQKLQSETAANLTALKQSILHKAFQGELIN